MTREEGLFDNSRCLVSCLTSFLRSSRLPRTSASLTAAC
eukprot:CAMPEP_0195031928 /NCGR_PEP_ID=MMETSP0326_2-20130528/62387_1 /TAXON_ID=2866 ORGANISM="Crypthecodinium cohnii, Strain Seligo" /NCGR_SAMPLE_ID=MMETSP0326_2 /ASSEMBLY_ACC=CAM_ASM_000348 /LENGTH=38 /DNA_ID= /DNA_START= /DNA_END= /DNA_ORIENTATION=